MGLLTRFGVGSATVDTVLETQTVRPGDRVAARIEIEGGDDDQDVDAVELAVLTRYRLAPDADGSYRNVAIAETELTDGFAIEAGEQRTIDVGAVEIPEATPPTLGTARVWVATGLDVDWSLDPTDEDRLEVEPGPHVAALLEAAERLDLRLHEADVVESRGIAPRGFAQQLSYRPEPEGRYAGAFESVELYPIPAEDGLELLVEVDRPGLTPLGTDETHYRTSVDATDPEAVAAELAALIDEGC